MATAFRDMVDVVSYRTLDDTVAEGIDSLLEGLDRRSGEDMRSFAKRKGFQIVSSSPLDGVAAHHQIVVASSLSTRDANLLIARAMVRETRDSVRKRCSGEVDCAGPPEVCDFVAIATDKELEDMLAGALLIPANEFSNAAERLNGNARAIAQLFNVPVEAVLQRARNFGLTAEAA